jgi:hypothetical protein
MSQREQIAMYGCAAAVVVILWDDAWDEYVCQLHLRVNGQEMHLQPRADYHTDDEGDARLTAKAMLKPYVEKGE